MNNFTEKQKLQSITKTKTTVTMEQAWETGMLLASLAYFTLSSSSNASIWSEYYNIVRRESTDWNNWANQSCKVFRGSVLKCMDSGNNISLVGFNGTHCASCYPVPEGGVAVKLSDLNSDVYSRNGKSLTWDTLSFKGLLSSGLVVNKLMTWLKL